MNDAQTDPRLVRLVARHFNDLQGLRHAGMACAIAITAWVWLRTTSEPLTFAAGTIGIVLGTMPLLFLEPRYARLGRIPMAERERFIRRWIGVPIGLLTGSQAHHLPHGPSYVCLGISVYPLWLVIDGWPWRWYHVLTCTAAVYVAFGRAAAPQTDYAWMAPRLWVFSLAMIVAAIADHALLVRTMRVTGSAAEEPAW